LAEENLDALELSDKPPHPAIPALSVRSSREDGIEVKATTAPTPRHTAELTHWRGTGEGAASPNQ